MSSRLKVMASIAALTVGFGVAAIAQNLPPVGPTGARAPADGVVPGPGADGPIKRAGQPGYDHPNQHLHRHPVSIAENMEPVIQHPDQDQEARQKLSALEARTGKKPNVVIFLLDDVGYADFGFTGGGITVGNPTPDVDRIAAESLILTSAYAQPTCSPTRASILTGQFPIHHGIQSPPMYGQPGGLEGLITLPKLMSEQGYTTQAIGKWHVGENEGSQPHNVGFDDFRGFLSVSDMYTEWRDPTFNPEIALSPSRTRFMQDLPFSKDDIHAVKGGEIEKIREITPETMKDLDQEWLKYGQEFLRKQADTNKPFFLYYGTRGCHFDNYPNEYYAGRSPARTVYSDCIVEMNDIFARLYQTLEETGQLENTLIVFTSDNGPEAEVPPYGRTWFRGGKGSTWEGGVRVPTFVHWKGMIEPRKSEGLFDLCDLFNTALSLAGKPGAEAGGLVPQDRYIDGIDQTSFVLAPNGETNRRSLLYFLNGHLAAVRLDEFKFHVFVQVPNAVTVRGQQGGITGTMQKSVGSIMFNLYTNPQEDDSTGIRHIPMGVPISNEFDRYVKVLKRFPERTQVGVQ